MHTDNRMHRRPLAVAALAVSLLLNACGGGGGGEAPAPPPPPLPGSFADPVAYSNAANGSLSSPQEGAAVVSSSMTLAGKKIDYTATTGHLTATDALTGQPTVSFF